MKKYFSAFVVASLLLFTFVTPTLAYTVKKGDTPYKLWGSNWKEELKTQVGTSDPTKLPVGKEVNLEQKLGVTPYITPNNVSPIVQDLTTTNLISTNATTTNLNIGNIYLTDVASQTTIPPGSNQLINPTFDVASSTIPLQSWTTSTLNGAAFSVTSTAKDDNSALQMKVLVESDPNSTAPAGIIEQEVSMTAGASANLSYWIRYGAGSTASSTFGFMITNGPYQTFTQAMVLNTGVWANFTSTTIDNTVSAVITTDGTIPITNTYTQLDWATIEGLGAVGPLTSAPNGKLNVVFISWGKVGDDILVDNVDLHRNSYTVFNPVSVDLFNYRGTTSTLTTATNFCDVRTNNGSGECLISYSWDKDTSYLGINTDADAFDFTSGTLPLLVSTSTNPIASVNSIGTLKILNVAPVTVDLTQVSTTTLYTVPTGYSLYLDQIISSQTPDTYTVGWDGKFGSGTSASDWGLFTAVSTLNLQNVSSLPPSNTYQKKIYSAGSQLNFVVLTGATAASLTTKIYLIGTLIPN